MAPAAVIGHFKSVMLGGGTRHTGHNPGSAYAIFAMLAIVLGLAVPGVMLGRGNDGVKEVHEFLAYAMVAVSRAHIAGVALHTVRHRENLTLSMIHGYKQTEGGTGISSAQPMIAVIFLAITGGWLGAIAASYDAPRQTARLPLLGMILQLGEAEHESEGVERARGEHDEHDEDDD